MRNRFFLIMLTVAMTFSMMGCGIVKVVPIGEEGKYTGKAEFDSSAQSSDDWDQVSAEISAAAQAIDAAAGSLGSTAVAVSGSGTVKEFNTETPKHYLMVEVDGVGTVKIQAGGVYSGTTVRDVQSVKNFESFTNQTEWSQYAKALNKELDSRVVAPLGFESNDPAGKKVAFIGAADKSGDIITITPVSLTIE